MYKNCWFAHSGKSWACYMTAIFTETQLDEADSATIHELEELG